MNPLTMSDTDETNALRALLASVPGHESAGPNLLNATVKIDDRKWVSSHPLSVVAGFMFDEKFNFPIIVHDGTGSLPGDLHVNGLAMHEQFAMVGCDGIGALFSSDLRHRFLGVYESIMSNNGIHAIVNILALHPMDIRYLKDKEAKVAKFVHRYNGGSDTAIVLCDTGEPVTTWTPGLSEWLELNNMHLKRWAEELGRPTPTDTFVQRP